MRKRKVVAVISVILSFTLLLGIVPIVAKYITRKGEQSEITSENFYFTSDYLKADETPIYEIYGNSVTFKVQNFVDDLRINQSDITYTVSSDFGTVSQSGGTITGAGKSADSITLSYIFSDETEKEIAVTVTSTDVYQKELTAKFILLKPDGIAYEIKDEENRNYAELYIYMGNTAKTVSLSWDKAKLLIDETNDYVFTKVTGDKNAVEIDNIAADTTVKIVFFKNNRNENHTCGLTVSNGTITIS